MNPALQLILTIVLVLLCAVIGFQVGEEVDPADWVAWLGALIGVLLGLVVAREVAKL